MRWAKVPQDILLPRILYREVLIDEVFRGVGFDILGGAQYVRDALVLKLDSLERGFQGAEVEAGDYLAQLLINSAVKRPQDL